MSIGGAREIRTQHSPVLEPIGFMSSMGIPAAIAIISVITLRFEDIHWLGAIVWGVVATLAFTLFSIMGRAIMIDANLIPAGLSLAPTPLMIVVHLVYGLVLGLVLVPKLSRRATKALLRGGTAGECQG